MVCINCKYEHDYKFCPNCGEKSETPEITFRSILSSGFSVIMHMDKGFLSNIKNLFLNPNQLVNGYIKGKRKNIYNPISFLIVMISIYLIVDSFVTVKYEANATPSKIYAVGYQAGKFVRLYFKYFWLVSIVWLSVSTRLIFRRYNYAEHLAINSFVIGQATLISIISMLIFKNVLLFNPFVYISIIWMTYEVFKDKKRDTNALVLAFTSTFLFFVQLVVLVVLIGVIRSWGNF